LASSAIELQLLSLSLSLSPRPPQQACLSHILPENPEEMTLSSLSSLPGVVEYIKNKVFYLVFKQTKSLKADSQEFIFMNQNTKVRRSFEWN
jgi:hypothetical protein